MTVWVSLVWVVRVITVWALLRAWKVNMLGSSLFLVAHRPLTGGRKEWSLAVTTNLLHGAIELLLVNMIPVNWLTWAIWMLVPRATLPLLH